METIHFGVRHLASDAPNLTTSADTSNNSYFGKGE